MKSNFYVVQLPKYCAMIFIFLNIVSMYLYVGGNINDPNQIGYSFSNNFFSDLGTTISYSNQSNIKSCILFNLSLCIIGSCFSILFFKLKDAFHKLKFLSWLAAVCGVFAGLSFIGVAFTPANLFLDIYGNPWLHIIFAHWAFRLVVICTILYSILIFKTQDFENKFAYNFITFGVVVLIYVLYSEFYLKDPRLFPEELVKHVIAQKTVVIWMIFSVYIYSIGLGKYFDNHIENKTNE